MTINEQVAVKLGWIQPFSPEAREFWKDSDNDVVCRNQMYWIQPNGKTSDEPKPYSTDIAACFRDIVPKLKNFRSLSKFPDGWSVSWYDENEVNSMGFKGETKSIPCEPTPALAIWQGVSEAGDEMSRLTLESVRERARGLGFELNYHPKMIVGEDYYQKYEIVKDRGVWCGSENLHAISAYLDDIEAERKGK
jgi:hypothetical protein